MRLNWSKIIYKIIKIKGRAQYQGGQPEDIASMAVYLLSDEAVWVTGSNFELTGGAQTL